MMNASKDKSAPKSKRSLGMRILRGFAIFLVSLVLLVIVAVLLLQTQTVQNFARKKVVSYLENKLKTKVSIEKIDIDLPNSVLLKNVYFEDQTQDTLLAGGEMKVRLDMVKLLSNEINIREINLNSMTVKVKRILPDTVFNFQFIVDAFAGEKTKNPATQDTATMKINLDKLILDKIRVVYKDVLTGNDLDMYLGHLDTRIRRFDPTHFLFEFPTLNIDGLAGHFYQQEPLQAKVDSAIKVAKATPGPSMQLLSNELLLKNIDFAYQSGPGNIATTFKIKNLEAYPRKIDLENGVYELNNVILEQSSIAVNMKSQPAGSVKSDTSAVMPFVLRSDEVNINNSDFTLNDLALPKQAYGMDYAHLGLKDIDLQATNFMFSADSVLANIHSASLTEKSGFVLSELTTIFEFTPQGIALRDLYLRTPGSVIRDKLIFSYPSLEALQRNIGQAALDINMASTVIRVKDILTFAPQLRQNAAFSNPNAVFLFNANLRGKVDDLKLDKLQFSGLGKTVISLSGSLKGLPNADNFAADLNIRDLKTGRKDIEALLPKGSLPPNLRIPENLSASGIIRGNMASLFSDLRIKTSDGDISLKGRIKNATDPKKASYDVDVAVNNLQVSKLMANPQMPGPVTATFSAKGSGFDPAYADAKFDGLIRSVVFRDYNYNNLPLRGSVSNKNFSFSASISDPNIDLNIEANGKLVGAFPAINLIADIDSIKTLPLHLTPDALIYRGKIRAAFTNTDPDNLAGNFFITNSVIVANGQRLNFDTLSLKAYRNDSGQVVSVSSDFLQAKISGRYTLTQLGDVFIQTINPYFTLVDKYKAKTIDPYDFNIKMNVSDNPGLRALVPGLSSFKGLGMNMNFSSGKGLSGELQAPLTDIQGFTIRGLNMKANSGNGQIALNTSIDGLKGSGIEMFATNLNTKIANNQVQFDLAIKDRNAKDKYTLSANFNQPSFGNYDFSISPNGLLLNYDTWSMNPENNIALRNGGFIARNFVLSHGRESLVINSTGTTANSPLRIDFNNFRIATILGFVQSDSLYLNGMINGQATVNNIQTQPSFTSSLTVSDLSFNKDTLGNLKAEISNLSPNIFNTNISLSGRGNDLVAKGTFYQKPANKSSFDIDINIGALQLNTLEGASNGSIRNSSGNLSGKMTLKGTIDDPRINGKIDFNKTSFNLAMLNSRFSIDNESIVVDNTGIKFDTFIITDSLNNTAILNGQAYTKNFLDYRFGLNLTANNFRVMNTTKKPNALYYGDLYISTDLKVLGTDKAPVIDGNLKVEPNTKLTVVLPQAEPGVVDREGIVRFVDYDAPGNDSLFMKAYDSLNTSAIVGFDIATNIEIDKGAEFNLIVDQGSGDFLRVKGEALLTAGIDPSGKINMTGSYELAQGAYELSFNFLKRKFDIEQGSRIVWRGEPTNAEVNVSAVYEVELAPIDLVGNQITGTGAAVNIYRQKLPFEVVLNMRGELMKPEITFDIRLAEANYGVAKDIISNVQIKLAQIRQEPAELNKQAFAVILLNRFISETPFDNSSGGLDAASFAKQSASKLLTEQLNRLATGLIEDVNINFDLTSSEDYTTGEKRQRTDLSIGLSKKLLDDRLNITVGSNFELEGPRKSNSQGNNLAGNIAIDYLLTKNGRYMVRAYRKNEYEGVLEGYIVETGINFIVTLDYDRFREIFKSRENRKKENEQRKAAAEALKQRELERQKEAEVSKDGAGL